MMHVSRISVLSYFIGSFSSRLSSLNTNSLSLASFATDAGRSSLKWLSEPDPTGQLSSNTPTCRWNQSRGWGWDWGWSCRWSCQGTGARRPKKLIPALGPHQSPTCSSSWSRGDEMDDWQWCHKTTWYEAPCTLLVMPYLELTARNATFHCRTKPWDKSFL